MAPDASTWLLRTFLRMLGYDARPWGLGRNYGPTNAVTDVLPGRLQRLHVTAGGPVSLVGVSLGGIFARDLARSHPDLVRQVISLGSPFRLPVQHAGPPLTHAESMYRRLRPWHSQEGLERAEEHELPPLSVPSTAIYTRTDGIVPWRACLERESPVCKSIEVKGSHIGLGHNPVALLIIARLLARPHEQGMQIRLKAVEPIDMSRRASR